MTFRGSKPSNSTNPMPTTTPAHFYPILDTVIPQRSSSENKNKKSKPKEIEKTLYRNLIVCEVGSDKSWGWSGGWGPDRKADCLLGESFPSFGAHWNCLGVFKRYRCLACTLSLSDLISVGLIWTLRFLSFQMMIACNKSETTTTDKRGTKWQNQTHFSKRSNVCCAEA